MEEQKKVAKKWETELFLINQAAKAQEISN